MADQHRFVEITVSDLDQEGINATSTALGVAGVNQGTTVLFEVADKECQRALEVLMGAGARVQQVQPKRQNLEALFVKEAETHGGE